MRDLGVAVARTCAFFFVDVGALCPVPPRLSRRGWVAGSEKPIAAPLELLPLPLSLQTV